MPLLRLHWVTSFHKYVAATRLRAFALEFLRPGRSIGYLNRCEFQRICFSSSELQFVKPRIKSALGHQFRVGSLRDYVATVDHANHVRSPYGRSEERRVGKE